MLTVAQLPRFFGQWTEIIVSADVPAFTNPEKVPALLASGISMNFTRAGSALGAWPPRKDNLSHPLLIKSGALYQAATSAFGSGHVSQSDGRSLFWGVSLGAIPYARAQHFGHVYAHNGAVLPARPYLYVDQNVIVQCAEVVVADLAHQMREVPA